MQTQYWKFFYLLANCIITLKNNLFPYCCLLIICIIIMVFSFQGTSEPLRLIETLCWRLQSISKSNKWIRLTGLYSASPRVIVHMLPFVYFSAEKYWWAKVDSNHRPHDYQSCALASWAIGPFWVVEISGIEPLTSCLQGRRSPSWAKPPSSRAS